MNDVRYFFKLDKFSLFFQHYAYLDVKGFAADDVFINHGLRVFFGDLMTRPDDSVVIVFCKVWKWDSAKFENAMNDVVRKIIVSGYSEYPEIAKEVSGYVESAESS